MCDETLDLEELANEKYGCEEEIKNPFWSIQHPKRAIVCGTTCSGKTHTIISMLLQDGMVFDRIYIYSKSLKSDRKYKLLLDHLFEIQRNFEKANKCKIPDFITVGETYEDIPTLDKFDRNYRNLVLIDDFLEDIRDKKKQDKFVSLYTRGRHKNVSCLFLTQSYFDVPPVIRLNTEYLLLHRSQSERNTMEIAYDCSAGMSVKEFIQIFNDVTNSKPVGAFLMVDKTKPVSDPMRLRSGWHDCIVKK